MDENETYYCECCWRELTEDEVYTFDGETLCDDCYEKHNHSPIHEYSYKPSPIFYGDGKRYFGVELEIDGAGKNKPIVRWVCFLF